MIKIYTLALVCALLIPLSGSAQTNGKALFGIDLVGGIPHDQFATYSDNLKFGAMVNFLYQPSEKIPISIGGDLGWLANGRKVQYEELTADITAGGVLIDQLYFPLRIETMNNIFTGHIILRITAPTNVFLPYAEGFLGFNNFFTSTSIYDESEENYFSETDNQLITSEVQQSDWGLSYGAAAGLLIQLKDELHINLKFAYNMGTAVSYYTKEDIQNWTVEVNNINSSSGGYELDEDNIDVSAIPKTSKTDMLQPTLGISFRF
jgi:hypothetical protein